ncbi:MAG: GatB/YqeY domain-containing protein, partial [Candidatus Acidiferrum sp.]
MTLSEKIQKDLTDAMRSKDELRLSVLRGIKSAIQYKETEKIRALDEAESIQILQTLVKQRKESIDQFGKGGRQDLVDKETKELAILET